MHVGDFMYLTVNKEVTETLHFAITSTNSHIK